MASDTILAIKAREILDSRGDPTVEVEVRTEAGWGLASAPSGASKGRYEAIELRDGDAKRYHGKGVLRAVKGVEETIAPKLVGMRASQQREIDALLVELDGTEGRGRLGANALVAVSMAVAKAAANSLGLPLYSYLASSLESEVKGLLPIPLMNLINGGKHAGNRLKLQEFMVVPLGAKSFSEALRWGAEIYKGLGRVVEARYGPSAKAVGDEGGYSPPMSESREALNALLSAIEGNGLKPGRDVALALDAAASSFYDAEKGLYEVDGRSLTAQELMGFYEDLLKDYPIVSLEDPFHEEAFQDFAELTKRLRGRAQVVGDDLFVTNAKRIALGSELGAASALILKVNQVGTLSEAKAAADEGAKRGYKLIVSHRSGETEDTFIADLAVGLNAPFVKLGAPARGERTAKYNRLLRIEEELGGGGGYWGGLIGSW